MIYKIAGNFSNFVDNAHAILNLFLGWGAFFNTSMRLIVEILEIYIYKIDIA